jgi:hypothetical protein
VANEAVDAEAAHGLVTQAEAGGRVAAHDEAPLAYNLSILIDAENAGPEGLAGATSEYAEMVRILEVFSKHDVAEIQEGGQL